MNNLNHEMKSAARRSTAARATRRADLRVVCAAGVLMLAAASIAFAQGGLPAAQKAGNVEYVTGGFGENMADAFKQAESSYPLALTFAEDAGGGSRPYVAEVGLVIKDKSGNVVADVPSVGPYFLARLEPGSYSVEATYMGKTQTQAVTVKEGGTAKQVITWKTQ